MSHLLLVEDDNSLGQTLKERLEKEGFAVEWQRTMKESQEIFLNKSFDLVILDVGLPDGDGFQLAEWIRSRSPVPFLFVTAQGGAEDRLRGYELGAEEYIPKPFHLKEFLIRVGHVLETHRVNTFLKIGDVEIDLEAMTLVDSQGRSEKLSQKDFLVLKYLVEASPKVISRDELLNRVWGDEKFPSNRTVDNCVLRLRQSLGEEAGAWIRSVRGIGYQWIEPVEVKGE